MESRITELEIRLTHQEAALDALTGTVSHYENSIQNIVDQLDHIKSMLKELAPGIAGPTGNEKPPHY